MEQLPAGWRILADKVYSHIDSLQYWYRYLLAVFILFTLVAPVDNLLEVPHGVYLWAAGEQHPFAQWKKDYDPGVVNAVKPDGLNLGMLPPLTALPGLGFNAGLLIAAIFLGTQYSFLPHRGVSLAVPVFGWFLGALAGSATLLFLEFAARLRLLDEQARLAAAAEGWMSRAVSLAGGWQNRPWVYAVVAVTGSIAAIFARRLLRKDPERGRLHLLLILFVGAASISLAGFAVDLATRIRQPATFLSGTFVTLLIAGSMVVWSLGPLLEAWKQSRSKGAPAS